MIKHTSAHNAEVISFLLAQGIAAEEQFQAVRISRDSMAKAKPLLEGHGAYSAVLDDIRRQLAAHNVMVGWSMRDDDWLYLDVRERPVF